MAAPSTPRRRAPLVAPGRVTPAPSSEPPSAPRRSAGAGIAMGLATAIAAAGLLYALCAGPIYVLAQIATDGLDRPVFRTALVGALVVSVALGAVAGVTTGIWYGRGGHLPSDRRSFTDR